MPKGWPTYCLHFSDKATEAQTGVTEIIRITAYNAMTQGGRRNREDVHTLGEETQDMTAAVDLTKILHNPTRQTQSYLLLKQ